MISDRDRVTYVTIILTEYTKMVVLLEEEGYRPPTIAKILESEGITNFSSVDRERLSFYYE